MCCNAAVLACTQIGQMHSVIYIDTKLNKQNIFKKCISNRILSKNPSMTINKTTATPHEMVRVIVPIIIILTRSGYSLSAHDRKYILE